MLRESGSGQDIPEVSGGALCKKRGLLIAWNISSLAIDSLCDQEGKEDIIVAALYCDYLNQQEQTSTNMIGAILKQLVGKRDIPEDLRETFQEEKKMAGGRGPRLTDLMRMFRATIASLPQIFISIDALDECLPKHLPELLGSLRDLARESPKMRIFLTGRPHVTEDIRRYFPMALMIPFSPNGDDIKGYLEMKLDRDTEPEAMNDSLRADILRIIMEKTSDMYVRVSSISTLSKMYTYQRLYIDSSSFHSTSKPFWEKSQSGREERNLRR